MDSNTPNSNSPHSHGMNGSNGATANGHPPTSNTSNSSPKPPNPNDSPQLQRAFNRLQALVENALSMRTEFFRKFMDKRRNLDDECGYPVNGEITAESLWGMYDRDPISRRVVELMPRETWQVTPMVYEDESSQHETDFEMAWDDICSSIRGHSYHKDEEGAPLWEYLCRADIQSGIGTYGLILLGINDGRLLQEPAFGYTGHSVDGAPKDITGVSGLTSPFSHLNTPISGSTLSQMGPSAGTPQFGSSEGVHGLHTGYSAPNGIGSVPPQVPRPGQQQRGVVQPSTASTVVDYGNPQGGPVFPADIEKGGAVDRNKRDKGNSPPEKPINQGKRVFEETNNPRERQIKDQETKESGKDVEDRGAVRHRQNTGVSKEANKSKRLTDRESKDNGNKAQSSTTWKSVEDNAPSNDREGVPVNPSQSTPQGALQKDIYGGTFPVAPLTSAMGTDAQYTGTQFSPSIGMAPGIPGSPPVRQDSGGRDSGNNLPPNGKNPNGGDSEWTNEEGEQEQEREWKSDRKLLFVRVFPEYMVQVVQYEADLSNPRFGQPVMYLITLNDPRQPHTGIGLPLATIRVHWTRVIHVADNLTSSEIFGTPRMRPVLNRLMDLQKLYGGSAEMYWKGAFPGISIETHPQLGGDVVVDMQSNQDMMENYFNGLQRYLGLIGMSAKTLSPTVVDPSAQINSQIEAICIVLGCPVRIFKGSERGELASSQDDASWNDRLRHRQKFYITPRIIVPFIDRLIDLGVLPVPQDGYSVEWPNLDSLSGSDKASIAAIKTQALTGYVSGNLSTIISPLDYLTKILDMDEEEAIAVLEGAAKLAEQQQKDMQDQQMMQQQQMMQMQGMGGMQDPSMEGMDEEGGFGGEDTEEGGGGFPPDDSGEWGEEGREGEENPFAATEDSESMEGEEEGAAPEGLEGEEGQAPGMDQGMGMQPPQGPDPNTLAKAQLEVIRQETAEKSGANQTLPPDQVPEGAVTEEEGRRVQEEADQANDEDLEELARILAQ